MNNNNYNCFIKIGRALMNLNHIAKKPFFDLFYRTPCMPILLKAAFHDAATFDAASQTGY